jgi:two-component system sensor histidine kinase AgrC
MENNYEGLHDYYFKNILKTSQALDNHNFDFEPIHHMKVSQIKGIILSKLLEAIDLGISIELEAKEPIESVQIDSNILIRALGILLDNAIEELQSIGQGKLNVTFYPNDADVVIIVSNTCRERIESIQKLKTKNFSTKGENRGLGLSSLDKFRAKHKNLNVHTKIEENTFIQKITIKGV